MTVAPILQFVTFFRRSAGNCGLHHRHPAGPARDVVVVYKVDRLTRSLADARRPFKVVAVALANKMARTAWALMVHGGTYRAPELAEAV